MLSSTQAWGEAAGPASAMVTSLVRLRATKHMPPHDELDCVPGAHDMKTGSQVGSGRHGQSLQAKSQVLADLPFSFLSRGCRCMGPDFRELELELVSQVAIAQRKLQAGPAMALVSDHKPTTCTVAVHCKQLQRKARHGRCNTPAIPSSGHRK